MADFFSSSFVGQINSLARNDSSLRDQYSKVSGKIRAYALSINLSPDDLLVMHIADDRAHLSTKFISFVENLSGKAGATPERIKSNRGEIYSRVGRLVTAIFSSAMPSEDGDKRIGNSLSGSFLELQAPEWMSPLINIFGRDTGDRFGRVPKGVDRLTYPLTPNSMELLSVLLKVTQTSKCSSLRSLLVDCRSDVTAEIRLRHLGSRFNSLICYLSGLRRKLGYNLDPPVLQSLPFEKWSPKFQKQWNTYEKLALSGISETSSLAKMATHYKMSLGKCKPITVTTYKDVMLSGLFHCQPLPEDWGIEDLLSLDVRTTTIFGFKHSESYNPFIDRYRTREQDRESKVKRKGFNSVIFEKFTDGLAVIAGFNGLFDLVQPFRRAYGSNLDVESKRSNKDEKKKLFSISEIDENIARLELEFNQIVKDRSFERQAGVSKHETGKKMRLCLFLPLFTALRFLGLRQRNVRNFRLMRNPENRDHPEGNVGFRKDNTLVIHFTKEETKNKKPLHLELNLAGFETHAPLIRILKTYYKKVYPYIRNNAASSLDEQFFVHMPQKFPGQFAFLPNTARAIDTIFVSWGNEFLSFKGVTAKNFQSLYPHHLRGICVDWLVKVLHCSLEEVAEYIADTVEMLRKEYLDRNRVHDATFILAEKNRELRAAALEKEALEEARRAAEKEKIEAIQRAEKDRAAAALQEERHNLAMERMDRMHETIQSMERSRSAADAKLAKLEAENKALAAENARLKNASKRKAGADATAT
jgi:AraC-like DNA-binding protein